MPTVFACADGATINYTTNGQVRCPGGNWIEYNLEDYVVGQLFMVPDTVELGAALVAGFSLPMIGYLVSWAYGTVINFINK